MYKWSNEVDIFFKKTQCRKQMSTRCSSGDFSPRSRFLSSQIRPKGTTARQRPQKYPALVWLMNSLMSVRLSVVACASVSRAHTLLWFIAEVVTFTWRTVMVFWECTESTMFGIILNTYIVSELRNVSRSWSLCLCTCN